MKTYQKALAALTGIAGLTVLGSRYFYELAIPRKSKLQIHGQEVSEEEQKNWDDRMSTLTAWLDQQPKQELYTTSYDGLNLHASYLPAYEPTKTCVIVVHGYRSSPLNDFGELLPFYRDELKVNLLLVDDRGHGESEGDYVGFGYHDHFDVESWIDVMVKKLGEDARIFLHGVSMGAATVMITSGDVLPGQVKGIIEDCGYTSLKHEMKYCMKHYYHIAASPFMQEVDFFARRKAGYRFADCDAEAALKKTTIPFLMIHGSVDTFVPTFMLQQNYDACACEDKKMVLIEGAEHAESFRKDPERYHAEVTEFIRNHS